MTLAEPLKETYFLGRAIIRYHYRRDLRLSDMGRNSRIWRTENRLVSQILHLQKIPSHDVLGRLFAALDPKIFSQCFVNWVASIAAQMATDVVAIDGKTIRGAASQGNKFPLHIVTAFCAKNRLTLGQQSVIEKSNELTAIPSLLDLLKLEECTVTIDAIACQQNIAERIVSKKADYILQVKNNQQYLKDETEDFFNSKTERQINGV